jgi:hypothetical protein
MDGVEVIILLLRPVVVDSLVDEVEVEEEVDVPFLILQIRIIVDEVVRIIIVVVDVVNSKIPFGNVVSRIIIILVVVQVVVVIVRILVIEDRNNDFTYLTDPHLFSASH